MGRPVWVVVAGTRPEATKLASVVRGLEYQGQPTLVLGSGQHTDLLTTSADSPWMQTFLDQWTPLGTVAHPGPGQFAAQVADTLAAYLGKVTFPVAGVIVQGDTATAYGAAQGAQKAGVPVAHVEAGIRSGDPQDPWPEETFRVAIDRIAAWHLAPTALCEARLKGEGVLDTITVTGNTGIDTLWWDVDPPGLVQTPLPLVLITMHRRERWARLAQIVGALDDRAAVAVPGLRWYWPVHPNPIIQKAAVGLKHIEIGPPMGTREFRRALARARLVVTDSGGVQEEAAALGVPCCVVRPVSDRPESVTSGHTLVVGADPEEAAEAVMRELRHPTLSREGFQGFGDGQAGERIAQTLAQ